MCLNVPLNVPLGVRMSQPRNVIVLIADSLRYDSVWGGPTGLPYVEPNAIRFTQARSGGCWTLPATASLFTGLMPHEHGGTAQTRAIRSDVPTLAEQMREAGFATHQITANVATTHVFGLHRGFDEVRPIWHHVPAKFKKLHQLVVLAGKPRLRHRLFSRDFIQGKLSEDLDAAKVWLQSTAQDVFGQARTLLRENEARGKRSFLFLNLMEAHFPYHLGPSFKTLSTGLIDRVRELMGLFHLVNQSFLTDGRPHIRPDMLAVLRQRQRAAWEWLAPQLDAFVRELHEDTGNLVVFGSDHGDNFGEQGWLYHFSNVTDAGNRVPLFWLPHDGRAPAVVDTPVSARDVYGSLLSAIGRSQRPSLLLDEPEQSLPVMESFWYNNQGKTLPQYRYNQFAVLEGGVRYALRQGQWSSAAPTVYGEEPVFEPLPRGVNPIEEIVTDVERRARLLAALRDFEGFSAALAA